MTIQTIDLIKGLFQDKIEELKPTLLHLEHQNSLPLNDRIINLEQDQLDEQLKLLRSSLNKLYDAKKDFDDYESNNKHP